LLVLTRKAGEQIIVGDDIVITIVHAHNGKVRVGVEAPRDVTVHRAELVRDGAPVSCNRARRVEQASYLYVAPPTEAV